MDQTHTSPYEFRVTADSKTCGLSGFLPHPIQITFKGAPVFHYPLVPGPTMVLPSVLASYQINFPSPDFGDEFFVQYQRVADSIAKLLNVPEGDSVTIHSGEGMIALWGALKSCIKPGDKVLCVATGLFGYGIGEMATQIGAQVEIVGLEYNTAIDSDALVFIEEKMKSFQPKMVTIIHCETPSGILNPLEGVGLLYSLFYVDAVASAFGVELDVGKANIDLGLIGSQKCLSLPPDLSIVTVSSKAWKAIEDVNYIGYDALKPFKNAVKGKYFPYTHNWRAIEALEVVLSLLNTEGFNNTIERHNKAAKYCRERVQAMGLSLYPEKEEWNSPTVTAVNVPEGWTWAELNTKLKAEGVAFGGNFGKLQGKVFRIGHMGSQASLALLEGALNILQKILSSRAK